MDHLRLIAPVADAACQGLGEAQAALRLAQQDEAAVRRDQAAVEGGAHPLASDAWQIEGQKAMVGHGGRGVSLVGEEVARTPNSYSMATPYTTSATPKSDRTQVIRAKHRDGYWFSHGKRVKSALIREIGGKYVCVSVEGTDRFGRLLGTGSGERVEANWRSHAAFPRPPQMEQRGG